MKMVSLIDLLQLTSEVVGADLMVVADNAKSHAPPGSIFDSSNMDGDNNRSRSNSENNCRWSGGGGSSSSSAPLSSSADAPLCPPPRPPQSPKKSPINRRRFVIQHQEKSQLQQQQSDEPVSLPRRQASFDRSQVLYRKELIAALTKIVDDDLDENSESPANGDKGENLGETRNHKVVGLPSISLE